MKKNQTLLLLVLVFFSFLSSCRKDIAVHEAATPKFTTSTIDISGPTYIPLSKAQEVAQTFLQNRFKGNAITTRSGETTTTNGIPVQNSFKGNTITIKSGETITKNGIPYLHIFNTDQNHGYVILAADSIYSPVLAYDSTGNFSIQHLNGGLVQWINKHGKELDYLRKTKTPHTDSIIKLNKIKWKGFDKKNDATQKYTTTSAEPYPSLITSYSMTPISLVGPLCLTQWDQIDPWNQYCPSGNFSGGHTPSGCVPTAMAQIMYFWQYPQWYDYTSMVKFIDPSDPSTWPSNNPGGFTESARLVHDIGTTPGDLFMTGFCTGQFACYSDNGTGANEAFVPYVFGQFGYSSVSRTETVSDQIHDGAQNGTAYGGFLSDYISQNQTPCIVSGFTGQNTILGLIYWPYLNGHSWVCDGSQKYLVEVTYTYTYYTQTSWGWLPNTMVTSGGSYTANYVHMNWGYGNFLGGNNNDGWYDCSINYSQPSSSTLDFGYFQTVIYNIHP